MTDPQANTLQISKQVSFTERFGKSLPAALAPCLGVTPVSPASLLRTVSPFTSLLGPQDMTLLTFRDGSLGDPSLRQQVLKVGVSDVGFQHFTHQGKSEL